MKHTKHIIPIVLGLIIIIALLFCTFSKCGRQEKEIVTDTVTVEHTDTLYDTATMIHFYPQPIKDTVFKWEWVPRDTMIPYICKTYSDTVTKDDGASVEYVASVSGINPNLDSIRFNLTYPVITNDIIHTVTKTEYVTKNQSKLGVGVGIGAGYGFFHKQPDIYAGLTLSYRF